MASGDRTARRLVDMTVYPAEAEYEPPPQAACEYLVIPIDLTDDLKLQTVQYIYRGQVVRFAIMLYYSSGNGAIAEVSRIDTCHGTVHRHRFKEDFDDELGDPQIIHRILVDGSEWEVVNSHYDQQLDQMIDEAEEYFRRWRR